MRRSSIIVICVFLLQAAYGQRELIYAKDPSTLRFENFQISHYRLPAAFAAYKGIRFVDARAVKSFCGFIRPLIKSPARKLATELPLEEVLNKAVVIRKDSAATSDSVVVVLRNFWLYRSSSETESMYCHMKALFFVKRNEELALMGKLDTVLNRKAVIRYEYKDLPALFIEDMLESFNAKQVHAVKKYDQATFDQIVKSHRDLPATDSLPNGILFSFADFMKGKVYATAVNLAPFHSQYLASFDNAALGEKLLAKAWGAIYQGALYIRNGRHFDKAYPLEESYLLLNHITTVPGTEDFSVPLIIDMENGQPE